MTDQKHGYFSKVVSCFPEAIRATMGVLGEPSAMLIPPSDLGY